MIYAHGTKVKLKRKKLLRNYSFCKKPHKYADKIMKFLSFLNDNEIEYCEVNGHNVRNVIVSLTAEGLDLSDTIRIPDRYVKSYIEKENVEETPKLTPKFKVGDIVYVRYFEISVKYDVQAIDQRDKNNIKYFLRNLEDDRTCNDWVPESKIISEEEFELRMYPEKSTSSPKFKVGDVAYIDMNIVNVDYNLIGEDYIKCYILEKISDDSYKVELRNKFFKTDVINTFRENVLLTEDEYLDIIAKFKVDDIVFNNLKKQAGVIIKRFMFNDQVFYKIKYSVDDIAESIGHYLIPINKDNKDNKEYVTNTLREKYLNEIKEINGDWKLNKDFLENSFYYITVGFRNDRYVSFVSQVADYLNVPKEFCSPNLAELENIRYKWDPKELFIAITGIVE